MLARGGAIVTKITDNSLINQYDQGLQQGNESFAETEANRVRAWFSDASLRPDGKLSQKETGLSLELGTLRPNAEFVRDFSAFLDATSPEDAMTFAREHMSRDAVLAYLANKYPNFFERHDAGTETLERTYYDIEQVRRGALDGTISRAELEQAGGFEQLLQDFRSSVTHPKDAQLLAEFITLEEHAVVNAGRQEQLREAARNIAAPPTNPLSGALRKPKP